MPIKILICDDSLTVCKVLEQMLMDYETDVAMSGLEAMEILEDHNIVFLDQNLGGVKGSDVARIIKSVRNCITIGISGDKYNGNAFDYFIQKPLTIKNVYKALGYAEQSIRLGRY
jgi:CheY-like chemotaxis protein